MKNEIENIGEDYPCHVKGCSWKKRNGRCSKHYIVFALGVCTSAKYAKPRRNII